MKELLLTLAVGLLVGLLFYRMKVPAGMLVGALVGVSILSIATQCASMPSFAKVIAQITAGTYIGCMVQKSDIENFPRVLRPFLVVIGSFLLLNLVMGFVLWFITPLDLLTSLLCSMPGGITDTPLIAMSMGADVPKVTALQLVRLVFGLGALPGLIVSLDKAVSRGKGQADSSAVLHDAPGPAKSAPVKRCQNAPPQKRKPGMLVLTLLAATAGGVFGNWLGIPAGALMLSMLPVAVISVRTGKTNLPIWGRRLAQVLSGCCIGSQMTLNDVKEMKQLAVPALLLVAGYFVNCVVTGSLLKRLFSMSRREGMLSVAPAGASEMALIAADLGVDGTDLVVIQVGRLLTVMALFPQLFAVIVSLFT